MSLKVRAIANSMTVAVNENVTATINVSTGYTVSDDGTTVPTYESITIPMQLQSMSSDDLDHMGLANQQGLFMYAYANGMIDVLNREDQKGNSMIETVKYGTDQIKTWKVMQIAESYNDWVKVVIRYVGAKQ